MQKSEGLVTTQHIPQKAQTHTLWQTNRKMCIIQTSRQQALKCRTVLSLEMRLLSILATSGASSRNMRHWQITV